VSGWALYGEVELNAGYPLMVGDYIVVGIQTDPNKETTRVARVEGILVPDSNGQKKI
jgi:hypothetical protein